MTHEHLQNIIQKLKKEDSRWDAILELKLLTGQHWAPLLVPFLKNEDWVIRWCVVEKLGDLGDRRAIKPLMATFLDPDAHVRKNTTKALIRLGVNVIPYVIPYFAHPSSVIRKQVYDLLFKMGSKILFALEQLLPKQNWVVANRMVDVIWRIGGANAENALIRALPIKTVQKNALLLLGELKCKNALPHLLDVFDVPSSRRAVLYALSLIGKEESYMFIVNQLTPAVSAASESAEAAVMKIGSPILPYLVKGLLKPNLNKRKMVHLITRIGPESVMPDIHKLAERNEHLRMITEDLRKKYPPNNTLGNLFNFLKQSFPA